MSITLNDIDAVSLFENGKPDKKFNHSTRKFTSILAELSMKNLKLFIPQEIIKKAMNSIDVLNYCSGQEI